MEEDIRGLKEVIKQKDAEILRLKSLLDYKSSLATVTVNATKETSSLTSQEITRYSRQLILPEIGVSGQISLKQTSVLIVGAGGLGCPAGLYLAAAGIGEIGIVDHDVVEVSNLHRQVAHTIDSVGEEKSKSLQRAIEKINSNVKCHAYSVLLNSTNIEEIIKSYSIILDASDNVPTRYLLNDAAVLFNKHLVSGSALRFEGQLTVYNYLDGPCYRCLFPKPPSSDTVTNCSDGGILGVVTGVIGSLQALEVIKIATGNHPSYYKKMLLFDGVTGDFRVLKLRSKKIDCAVCGTKPSIIKLIDYELFCNRTATDKDLSLSLLSDIDRISCVKLKQIFAANHNFILLDVRPVYEFKICSLFNAVNIPINDIEQGSSLTKLQNLIDQTGCRNNYIICRRGNDSQRAVLALRKLIPSCTWHDVIGGLNAWHHEVDLSFPIY